MDELNLEDALRIAAVDKKFASSLTLNPEKFAKVFNLTDSHIESIKDAKVSDVAKKLGGETAAYYG